MKRGLIGRVFVTCALVDGKGLKLEQGDPQSYSLLIEDAGRLSLLAHDIRATYTELQITLSTLRDSFPVSPALGRELSRLSHTGAHLGRLLNEMSGALFQNHQNGPYPALFSTPRRTLAGLVQRWRGITEQLGSYLLLQGEENMPETAAFDMLAFERVLSNLVSNALHHAGPGPISIDISRSDQSTGETLLVRIRDAGPGFPSEVLTRAAPAPLPIGSGEPGSGFGLRIACEATRQLNGHLTLHNPPDGGAEACLSVPLPELSPPSDPVAEMVPALPTGLTALLVEDSAALRLQMRQHLEALGIRIVEASDGAAALHLLTACSRQFDVVFLDIELPLLSGNQVLSILRSRNVPLPPVIAITSHVFESNIRAIQLSGADAVICKPVIGGKDILDSLVRALHMHPNSPTPLSSATHPPVVSSFSPQSRQPDATANHTGTCLRHMVRHLPKEMRQTLLRQVAIDLNHHLEAAFSAARAVPSPLALAELTRSAHTLSGLFASACHEEARQLALSVSERVMRDEPTEIIAILDQLRQTAENIQSEIHSIIDRETNGHVSKPHTDR
ncbi:CheY-like chemotaxis protein [Celeribacter persicus]|uniref:CheY-like chemotaxis protein n=1 Tax=Celeribacter persicus TaxID=1651082 RepID=A0A2T5HVV8_9RHOB|nr:CheY-like chemotaxis protein [Celeribacter persicus]